MLWLQRQQLKSSKWEVRAEAARRLGESRQKGALSALFRALGDEDPSVRLEVIKAIGSIGDPAAIAPLIETLARISRMDKSRRSGSTAVRAEEHEALATSLGNLGMPAVDPLLGLLQSDDREGRRCAAHALGLIEDPRTIGPLIERLGDDRSDVRKAAAHALGHFHDPQSLAALIRALSHRDAETRRASAEALGTVGAEDAVEALAAAAGDQNEPVQLAAIEALRRIGGLRAGAGLRSAIEGGKKAVREAAAAALASMKFEPTVAEDRAAAAVLTGDFQAALREGAAAVGALIEALGSRDASHRLEAARALAMLRPERAVTALIRVLKDHDANVQTAAATALAGIGPPAVAALQEAIDSLDATTERLAAFALGEIGDPRAAGALAGAIARNRSAASSYLEPLEAARAAANALARILASSSNLVSKGDLERIARVPDAVQLHQVGDGQPSSHEETVVDCSRIRELARQELLRRGSRG